MEAGGTTTTELQAGRAAQRWSAWFDPLHIYVAVVCAAGVCSGLALLYIQIRGLWAILPGVSWFAPRHSLGGFLFFLLVGVFAERLRVRVGSGVEVSAGFLADFLSAALLGPLVGALVASAAIITSHNRGQVLRTGFGASSFLIIGGATGLVYWGCYSLLGETGMALALAGLAAGCAYFLLNYILYVPVMWLRRGMGLRQWFQEGFAPFLPFHLFFLLLSLGLIYSFERVGPLGFGLFFLPVLGLIYAFRTFSNQRELARSLERFSLQITASMITALDLKDNYTAQHSAAVAQYAFDTASALGLPEKDRSVAHLAGLLHDLGKISVPDEILNSRERLGEDEWVVIQGHSAAGQNIVSNMNEFEELGRIIRHHHEHCDGRGYPDGLAGESIPMISRIVAVADSYSAMVSNRPYRDKRTPEAAIAELGDQSGIQFDPRVVAAFLKVLEGSTHEYRKAEQLDFRVQFQKVRFLREIA
ncbi:MAG: HD-GYP domain-containing protein [Thermoleophilia bacterium]